MLGRRLHDPGDPLEARPGDAALIEREDVVLVEPAMRLDRPVGERLRGAILDISNDRMTEVGELKSDLMMSPRLRMKLNETRSPAARRSERLQSPRKATSGSPRTGRP